MKRSPLRRTPMARGKTRVGAAAKRRIRAGGPLSKGRASLGLTAWRVLVEKLTERAEGRCENPVCRRRGSLDPHHVIKRSQGGADHEGNLVMICRTCHRATDLPHGEGRLRILRLYATHSQTGFMFLKDLESHDRVLWPDGLY